MIDILPATSVDDLIAVELLLREYVAHASTLHVLEGVPAFEGFEAELRDLPGEYALPRGRLLLALWEGQPAGCVCLRPVAGEVCELKRLYVRPLYRGRGIGWQLGQRVVDEARAAGYARMVLDTHRSMASAHAIYHELGFQVVEPPPDTPAFVREAAVFMMLDLSDSPV